MTMKKDFSLIFCVHMDMCIEFSTKPKQGKTRKSPTTTTTTTRNYTTLHPRNSYLFYTVTNHFYYILYISSTCTV